MIHNVAQIEFTYEILANDYDETTFQIYWGGYKLGPPQRVIGAIGVYETAKIAARQQIETVLQAYFPQQI